MRHLTFVIQHCDQDAPLSPPAKPTDAPWTVRRVLDWTIGYLKEHGSESARLDAEVLLAHARNCRRIQLYTDYDAVLPDDVRARMRELVKRRAAAEPVAYLVGHREFFSLDFEVTRDVLIPRPDTETLVVEALELLKPVVQPRVLDIGTGTGCIAISLALNRPEARVVATDSSPEALEVAARNAERHGVAQRIEYRKGDLFAPLREGEQFDLIVSNPPYVSTVEIDRLAADVREHEPRSALEGGTDGLDVIRRIVAEAAPRLAPGGWVVLECSPEQVPAVQALFAEAGYGEVHVRQDLAGRGRAVCARLPK
jgi:release factor glutamine methyltransferase